MLAQRSHSIDFELGFFWRRHGQLCLSDDRENAARMRVFRAAGPMPRGCLSSGRSLGWLERSLGARRLCAAAGRRQRQNARFAIFLESHFPSLDRPKCPTLVTVIDAQFDDIFCRLLQQHCNSTIFPDDCAHQHKRRVLWFGGPRALRRLSDDDGRRRGRRRRTTRRRKNWSISRHGELRKRYRQDRISGRHGYIRRSLLRLRRRLVSLNLSGIFPVAD